MTELNNINTISIEKEAGDSYLVYAMNVIVSRALPDVRDGLKPVHRRILYAMDKMNIVNYTKSARIVGDVIGKYHPHGDTAVYETMVRMAQDFSMGEMLVEGQGNFGSIDGDPPAAMRYTECKLQKISSLLLEGLESDMVDFRPNYDETLQEPEVLPAQFPNILVNGSSGIAVGMATNIPPYNISELCDLTYRMIEDSSISNEQIAEIIPAPDFPTGGVILGRSGSYNAMLTGRGSIVVRGVSEIEEKKNSSSIVITEIPYLVNKTTLIEKIASLVRDKKIEGISGLRDESNREGMRIVIDLKRDAIPDIILNRLYQQTQLQSSFSSNMLAIHKGKPQLMSIREIIEAFISFRRDIVRRKILFNLEKLRKRAHILIGLFVTLNNLDKVIELIKSSEDPTEAKSKLLSTKWASADISGYIELVGDVLSTMEEESNTYSLSEVQAQSILDLKLHRLTGLERKKLDSDLKNHSTQIKDCLVWLADKSEIDRIIKEKLLFIKEKYGHPRRTQISEVESDIDIEDIIPQEDMLISITSSGYIKRINKDTYKAQNRGGKGRSGMSIKEEDAVSHLISSNTHQSLLFFSDKGICYRLKCYRLPLGSPQSLGKPLINFLPLSQGEKITAITPLPRVEDGDKTYLLFTTSHGTVRKNSFEDFGSIRANGKIAMKLNEGETLLSVLLCKDNEDIFMATRQGQCIRFSSTEIRVFRSRSSTGVRGIKLKEGDEVVSVSLLKTGDFSMEEKSAYLKLKLDPTNTEEIEETITLNTDKIKEMQSLESFILTVSSTGLGKRTSSMSYRQTHRGGSGISNMKITDKTKSVCYSGVIDSKDEIMFTTESGQFIRLSASQIRITGRMASGVILFRLEEKDEIISATVLEHHEEESQETVETATE
ncbi:MAG: DNA gyrase subunit A [Alphaproteobacteria bacterium]|nr:DNA gyrase subunit A [Alphaproteobacteria bacterium]